MIPDEAVEAALKAMFEKKVGGITEFRRHGWTPTIRTILEAAAPHMLADPHAGFVAWFRSLGDSK